MEENFESQILRNASATFRQKPNHKITFVLPRL